MGYLLDDINIRRNLCIYRQTQHTYIRTWFKARELAEQSAVPTLAQSRVER